MSAQARFHSVFVVIAVIGMLWVGNMIAHAFQPAVPDTRTCAILPSGVIAEVESIGVVGTPVSCP